MAQTGINPLVAAAAGLLGLALRLRNSTQQRDVEGLRDRVMREIKEFENRAVAAGVTAEAGRTARYALCATIDDLVLNTPWGSASIWAKKGMVSTFHAEVWSGEGFFDILERMHRDPGKNLDVLELMYLCLSLGFEGKLCLDRRGQAELARIRDGIFRTVRQLRGDIERDLSPHWRGIEAGHRPLSAYIPAWVVALIAAALLTALFMGFSYALNGVSDGVFAELAGLARVGQVTIVRAGAPVQPVIAAERPAVQSPRLANLLTGLPPEVTVSENDREARITVMIPLFASGTATVQDRYTPILGQVAAALNQVPGRITVGGHTDNVPIRNNPRFRSNYDLSVARAESIQRVLAAGLSDPGRLRAEGFADAEPIASNDTAEGRQQNRRTEIILHKQPVYQQ